MRFRSQDQLIGLPDRMDMATTREQQVMVALFYHTYPHVNFVNAAKRSRDGSARPGSSLTLHSVLL